MVKKFQVLLNFLVIVFPLFSETQIVKGKTISSDHSMIVTRHYIASEVGNQILLDGGNAIDASVAVSFALSAVSYTHLTLPTNA